MSIPEIVKQFNERQSQKKKPKRRPHSSSIYTSSTKSTAIVDERNGKKTSYDYNTFITGAEKCLLLWSLCLDFTRIEGQERVKISFRFGLFERWLTLKTQGFVKLEINFSCLE